jgi:hypothetical protein
MAEVVLPAVLVCFMGVGGGGEVICPAVLDGAVGPPLCSTKSFMKSWLELISSADIPRAFS